MDDDECAGNSQEEITEVHASSSHSNSSDEERASRQEIHHSTIAHLTITNVVMSPTEKAPMPVRHEASETTDTEWTKVSPNFRYNHNRCVAGRQYIFYGEEMNEITGVQPAVIKLLSNQERNYRHAKICRKLNHQHIVTALHVGRCMLGNIKHIYIVLELCDDMNLHEYVLASKRDKKPFRSEISLDQSRQLMEALCYIHSKNIIHRDLKPHNVLLSREKKWLKITDFAMGTDTGDAASSPEAFTVNVGTPGYRAPEVCNSSECTASSDVFSLGLIFYFLWSYGLHPFGDDPDAWNINIKRGSEPSFQGLVIEEVNQALDLLRKMQHHSPQQRPTADQLRYFEIFSKEECGTRNKRDQADGGSPRCREVLRGTRCDARDVETVCKETAVKCKSQIALETTVEPRNSDEKSVTKQSKGPQSSYASEPENSVTCRGLDVRSAPNHSSARELPRKRHAQMPRPRSSTEMTFSQYEQANQEQISCLYDKETFNKIVVVDKLLRGTRVFNPMMSTWTPMHMLHPSLSDQNFTALTLSGYLYLLFNDKRVLRLKISKFNATWEDLPRMKYHHGKYPPALATRGKIFVVGSAGGDCQHPTRSIECFDQVSNRWSDTDNPMTTARHHHAVTIAKECIYCIGGVCDSTVLSSVELYDCYRKSWHAMPPMANRRANSSAVYRAGKLYVLGGYFSNTYKAETRLASVEAYDVRGSAWTIFTPMLKPRARFTALNINGDLFAVGGDEKSTGSDAQKKNTIEHYCFPNRSWKIIHVKKDVRVESMSAAAAYLLD